MISIEEATKVGIKPEDEKTPLDILGNNAMTTREIATKLSSFLPEGQSITYSCAKQKMVRHEKKGEVQRVKVDGLIHWHITQPKQ